MYSASSKTYLITVCDPAIVCFHTSSSLPRLLLALISPNLLLGTMSAPWMQELADVEDAATEAAFQAAQARDQVPPPVTKAQPPVIQEPPAVPISVNDRYADGTSDISKACWSRSSRMASWSPASNSRIWSSTSTGTLCYSIHCQWWSMDSRRTWASVAKAAQGINDHYWNREAREEAERANREYARSMADWRTRADAMGLKAHPAVPQGPPPKDFSSMWVLPDVHEALRQHDPTSKAPASHPSLPKKAPPTTGKGMPAGVYRVEEPPRIGSGQVQPAPPPKLPGSTPTTPAQLPRPPISALPQPVQESSNPAKLKHPLPQPARQGPPNKQVRHKAFPAGQQVNPLTSMPAPAAVDLSRMSAPSPKRSSSIISSNSRECPADGFVRSNSHARSWLSNVTWWETQDLYRQLSKWHWLAEASQTAALAPNLKGGPDSTKPFEELCMLRSNIPKITDDTFQQIFPSDNILCITQKTGGRHFAHLREAAAWITNGAHWFSVLKQPMMVVIERRDWDDEASKFQYLMQILQVNLGDYIPRCQIFVQQEEEVDKLVQYWMEPTTLWDGRPVIGFIAGSYLDDLKTVGFKHFNPMWTFPTTAVYQNWEPNDVRHGPLASSWFYRSFQRCSGESITHSCLQVMQYASSIGHCLQSNCSTQFIRQRRDQRKDLLPHDVELCLSMEVCFRVCRSIEAGRSQLTSMSRMHSKRYCTVEQQDWQSSKLRICRISEHSHEWCDGQSHSVFQSIYRPTYPVLWVRRIQRCQWYDPAAQWYSLCAWWFSTDPSSKERLQEYPIPSGQEEWSICDVSGAGMRESCLLFRSKSKHDRCPWSRSQSLLGWSSQSLLWMIFEVRIQDKLGCLDMGRQRQSKAAYYQRCFQEKPERSSQSTRSHRSKWKGIAMERYWWSQWGWVLLVSRQGDRSTVSSWQEATLEQRWPAALYAVDRANPWSRSSNFERPSIVLRILWREHHPRFACKHAYKHQKASMHIMQCLPCSISLSKSSMQRRKRKAKLGSRQA